MDPNTVRRLVRLAGVKASDRVVEVGAGLGTLTRALSAAAGAVVAIEIDRKLFPALTEAVTGLDNVTLVEADALRLDWRSLLGGREHRVIGNLPYSIATPLIAGLLTEVEEVRDFTIMVQREVGERLVAGPGSKAYGAVSVVVAYHARAKVAGRVPPAVFWPKPKVESVVVRLTRRPPPVELAFDRLMTVVRGAFGQRRKTVRNSLAAALARPGSEIEAALHAAGIPGEARAEQLDIQQFAALARAL